MSEIKQEIPFVLEAITFFSGKWKRSRRSFVIPKASEDFNIGRVFSKYIFDILWYHKKMSRQASSRSASSPSQARYPPREYPPRSRPSANTSSNGGGGGSGNGNGNKAGNAQREVCTRRRERVPLKLRALTNTLLPDWRNRTSSESDPLKCFYPSVLTGPFPRIS